MNFTPADDMLVTNAESDHIAVRPRHVRQYPRDYQPRSGRSDIRDGLMELMRHMTAAAVKGGLELVVDIADDQEAQELWREDDLAWLTLLRGTTSRYPLDRHEVVKGHTHLLREILDPAAMEKLSRHMEFNVQQLPASPDRNVVYERWVQHRPQLDMVWQFVREQLPHVEERPRAAATGAPKLSVTLNSVTMFMYMVTMNPEAYGTHVRQLMRGAYTFALEHLVACRNLGIDPTSYVSKYISRPYQPFVHDIMSSSEIRSAVSNITAVLENRSFTAEKDHYIHAKRVLIGALRNTRLIREVTQMLSMNTTESVSRSATFHNLFSMYKLLVLLIGLVEWICGNSRATDVAVEGMLEMRGGSGSSTRSSQPPPVDQQRMKAQLTEMQTALFKFVPALAESEPAVGRKMQSLFASVVSNIAQFTAAPDTHDVHKVHAFTLVLRTLLDLAMYKLYAWHLLTVPRLVDAHHTFMEHYQQFRRLKLSLKKARYASETLLAKTPRTRADYAALFAYMSLTIQTSSALSTESEKLIASQSADVVGGVLFECSTQATDLMVGRIKAFFDMVPADEEQPTQQTKFKLLGFGATSGPSSSTERSMRAINLFFLSGMYRTLDELDRKTPMTLMPLLGGADSAQESHPLVQQTSMFRSHLLDLIMLLHGENVVNYSALLVSGARKSTLAEQCKKVLSEAKVLVAAVHQELNRSDLGLIFIASSRSHRPADDLYPVGSNDVLARYINTSAGGGAPPPTTNAARKTAEEISNVLFIDAVNNGGNSAFDPVVVARNGGGVNWNPAFISSSS